MTKQSDNFVYQEICRLARKNPFLTTYEIAEQANTTHDYVRTTLSQSKLSLAKLRKEKYENLQEEVAYLRKKLKEYGKR